MAAGLVNVDLGKLAKPATVLVERVSDAVGGIAKPWQIQRVARAEGLAMVIAAQSEIEVTELQRRAARRWMDEETRKQINIEDITNRALPHVTEEAKPEDVEEDWIVNFFDKCRIVSDEQMQDVWARILAGEANNPGTFSRKTVNILADMDKSDAELFTTLCSFAWEFPDATVPLIYIDEDFFMEREINLTSLADMESFGLILTDSMGFALNAGHGAIQASYFGRSLELTLAKSAENQLDTGSMLLTGAGREIGSICGLSQIEGFFEFMQYKWEQDLRIEAIRMLE